AIVRIHDLLDTPDGDWLVLQYVEGPTLARRLRDGPLPPEQLATLARDILGALAAAHSRGLLHRDLKTENVVLTPTGHAMVLDFGLAKLYTSPGAPGETGTTGVVGTYRAMSPEQANGLALDPRSDLFSLGVLLYEAATGISPFLGETPVETLTRVCTHLQPPVHELIPTVPGPLSALIDTLLEKEVGRRPASASEALGWIEAERGAPPSDAAPTLIPNRSSPAGEDRAPHSGGPVSVAPYRGLRARRLPLALGFALLLAALGLSFFWSLGRSVRPPRAPLYVAVARPEVGLGAGREEVALAASALQAASLHTLASLEGLAALPVGAPEPGETAPTVQRLARLLAAAEVVTATLDCQAHQCQAVLRRQRGSDGRVLDSTAPFDVPLDDLHLLDTAASTYLKPLFPAFEVRPGTSGLQVRAEDYERYLRVERTWEEKRPADMEPLLAELDRIRAGSPLFLEAYLLEARMAGRRFFQARDPKDLDRALALLAEARRLAPGEPLPLVVLFDVTLNAGRLDEAEEAVRELELRLPGDALTLQRRALLMERRGDRRQALELLRAAVQRHPSARLSADLANLEMRLGEIPAARSTLQDLLQRLPGNVGGETLLAQLELETGDPARAADLYLDLVRRRPGFAELSNLGLSQLLLGRYPEAAASLRRAYELAPKTFGAALNLGDAETLLGHRAAGEALYLRVLELVSADPAQGDWQLLAAKAQAQAHLGRKMEAATTIQQALVAAPNNPDLAFEAALVYTLVGETASALANVDRALAQGFNRRWFSLPWFDPLRREPAFGERLAAQPAVPTPREAR
ncbi:MAG TPA: tetratricopeptide repeat protein, partial [Thermoanaerobaculia bacterium]|nr:tetratricopeptide repeat protein [Thermoanaerobaculia bacterium]